MFNLKKYPKKKALSVNDSIVVSRPDGSIINFNSPISVDNTGNATFSGNVTIQGNLSILNSASQTISFGDNDFLNFGNNNDLKLVHDGSDSFIENNTGDLKIIQKENDADIRFFCDDGTGSVAEYFRLDGADGGTRLSRQLIMQDNVGFAVGNALDFSIEHNGTDTTIAEGTGNLTIKNTASDKDIIFQGDNGSGGVTGYFFLYYF